MSVIAVEEARAQAFREQEARRAAACAARNARLAAPTAASLAVREDWAPVILALRERQAYSEPHDDCDDLVMVVA